MGWSLAAKRKGNMSEGDGAHGRLAGATHSNPLCFREMALPPRHPFSKRTHVLGLETNSKLLGSGWCYKDKQANETGSMTTVDKGSKGDTEKDVNLSNDAGTTGHPHTKGAWPCCTPPTAITQNFKKKIKNKSFVICLSERFQRSQKA